MKTICILTAIVLLLCGCGAQQTFETISDEPVLNVSAQPREIVLTLPEETLMPAMETDTGTLYLCDGFDVAVQTLEGGDLEQTIRQISGFGTEDLTIMQTAAGEFACFEFVWTAAADLGEQVSRAMILDDGAYHYVLTAIAPAEKSGEYQEIWNGIFETFAII